MKNYIGVRMRLSFADRRHSRLARFRRLLCCSGIGTGILLVSGEVYHITYFQSARLIDIIAIRYKPLARSYAVKYTDAWCATGASAAAIVAELTDIIPTECGCNQMIELFKKLGPDLLTSSPFGTVALVEYFGTP